MNTGAARFATSVLFLLHGLLVSAWVSRIPDVQTSLRLSEGVLGTAMLAIAVGSVVTMPLTGVAIARFGSRLVCVWTTCLFCLAVAVIPLAPNAWGLFVVLGLYGAGAGSMDVAMNAQGVTVQGAAGRSMMSSFHALFSIGGMVGALGGGQVARAGLPAGVHLALTGLLCACATLAVARKLLGPEREAAADAPGPSLSLPRGPVLALGALGFCILICEGAMADWIAIFLRDWRGAGPAMAAAGYAVFSGAMSVGRLLGDRVTDRAGAAATVRYGSAVAGLGLAFALVSGTVWGALGGFLLTGFGYAAIIPNVFAASARIPGLPAGAGIAAVTTMGYFGFLLGPPAIGWLAEWLGLPNALFTLVALSVAGSLLAGSVARGEPGTPSFEPDVHG